MLMMVGAVAVEVWPFNVHETNRKGEATFAEKAVLGRRPPLEAVGDGPETLSLTGRLFPQKLGGLGELEAIRAQMSAQQSIPVMRGDGAPLGWYVITSVGDKGTFLDAQGVGRVIEVSIELKRSDPGGGINGVIGMLLGLFS